MQLIQLFKEPVYSYLALLWNSVRKGFFVNFRPDLNSAFVSALPQYYSHSSGSCLWLSSIRLALQVNTLYFWQPKPTLQFLATLSLFSYIFFLVAFCTSWPILGSSFRLSCFCSSLLTSAACEFSLQAGTLWLAQTSCTMRLLSYTVSTSRLLEQTRRCPCSIVCKHLFIAWCWFRSYFKLVLDPQVD